MTQFSLSSIYNIINPTLKSSTLNILSMMIVIVKKKS